MFKLQKNEFTKRELELIVAGIKIQIDKAEKDKTDYDSKIRMFADGKVADLYRIWEKFGENNIEIIKS